MHPATNPYGKIPDAGFDTDVFLPPSACLTASFLPLFSSFYPSSHFFPTVQTCLPSSFYHPSLLLPPFHPTSFSPTISIPPLSLNPTSLPSFFDLTSFLPYHSSALLLPYILPPPLLPLHLNFTLPQSPTSILLPPFSLTLYILSNLHVPPIFFPLSPSHAVAHLQVQWAGCGTQSTSPAALATSN